MLNRQKKGARLQLGSGITFSLVLHAFLKRQCFLYAVTRLDKALLDSHLSHALEGLTPLSDAPHAKLLPGHIVTNQR
jgi:hypothetical protein